MNLFEKTIDSKEIYKGKIFTVTTDTVELPDGTSASRDIILHNGGVGVIAITTDGKIPMVRQYRKGIESVSLEIPAGKLEKGEDPAECGKRELKEETGYSAKTLNLLLKFAPTPAYCSEIIYIYIANGLSHTGQHLDEDEFLNVEYYTLKELHQMVTAGEITDAKTIIAIMTLFSSSEFSPLFACE